tara:strand:+ start:730 stop:1620 length:891 start_codon:yes stop_codon:yes gene_type:complete
MTNKVLIVGSNGFVGKNISSYLHGYESINVKTSSHLINKADLTINLDNIDEQKNVLKEFNTIVFCPAVFKESIRSKNINYDFPLKFFKHANEAGVKKFIFLSTTLVVSEKTDSEVFKIVFKDFYKDSYSRFKAKAEKDLKKVKGPTNLIILRLSHIYNNEVNHFRGIFKFLDKLQKLKFVILPSSQVKKSLLHIDNLNTLILKIIYSMPISGTFYVNDGYYYDLKQISKFVSHNSRGYKIKHLYVGLNVYKILRIFFKKKYPQFENFAENLLFSISNTSETFNWHPDAKLIEKIEK